MSQALFPALPGLAWDVIRTPMWSTNIQKTVSGREVRSSFYSAPLYKYSLNYDVLRQGAALLEWQTLQDFYGARSGDYDTFLFNDPNDNSVTAQLFGTGDGATAAWQLKRSLIVGGFLDPIYNANSAPAISINAVLQTLNTDYLLSASNLVTFILRVPNLTSAVGSGSGGTLAANTYFYKITALNAFGETIGSNERSVTTVGATSSVALTWGAVTGATSYRIYRGTGAGAENVYYTGTSVFTDTGAASTGGSPPGAGTCSYAPAGALPLTWTGTYYWRCRFADASVDFNNFAVNFWAAKKVDLITVKGPP